MNTKSYFYTLWHLQTPAGKVPQAVLRIGINRLSTTDEKDPALWNRNCPASARLQQPGRWPHDNGCQAEKPPLVVQQKEG